MSPSSRQVENYLQDVLNCQRKTLGNTLKRSLKRYPNQARVEWLMDADPPGSTSKTDPAQVERCLARTLEMSVYHNLYIIRCGHGVVDGSSVHKNCLVGIRRAHQVSERVRLQIALLVAGINYVLEVETTLDRVETGNNAALTGYHDLQVRAC